MSNILKYFKTKDVKANYTMAQNHAIDLVKKGNYLTDVKDDPIKDRFARAIENVRLSNFPSDVHNFITEDSPLYEPLIAFTGTEEFWKIETNAILEKAALNEKALILKNSQQKAAEICRIREEIKSSNPFIKNRNWIQKHIAWTRFSENKWIKGKKQEISDLHKKLDRNTKYCSKLSSVITKANNETNNIIYKNQDLFSKVKVEHEANASEYLAQQRARQTAQSSVSAPQQPAQSSASASQQPAVLVQLNLGGNK